MQLAHDRHAVAKLQRHRTICASTEHHHDRDNAMKTLQALRAVFSYSAEEWHHIVNYTKLMLVC